MVSGLEERTVTQMAACDTAGCSGVLEFDVPPTVVGATLTLSAGGDLENEDEYGYYTYEKDGSVLSIYVNGEFLDTECGRDLPVGRCNDPLVNCITDHVVTTAAMTGRLEVAFFASLPVNDECFGVYGAYGFPGPVVALLQGTLSYLVSDTVQPSVAPTASLPPTSNLAPRNFTGTAFSKVGDSLPPRNYVTFDLSNLDVTTANLTVKVGGDVDGDGAPFDETRERMILYVNSIRLCEVRQFSYCNLRTACGGPIDLVDLGVDLSQPFDVWYEGHYDSQDAPCTFAIDGAFENNITNMIEVDLFVEVSDDEASPTPTMIPDSGMLSEIAFCPLEPGPCNLTLTFEIPTIYPIFDAFLVLAAGGDLFRERFGEQPPFINFTINGEPYDDAETCGPFDPRDFDTFVSPIDQASRCTGDLELPCFPNATTHIPGALDVTAYAQSGTLELTFSTNRRITDDLCFAVIDGDFIRTIKAWVRATLILEERSTPAPTTTSVPTSTRSPTVFPTYATPPPTSYPTYETPPPSSAAPTPLPTLGPPTSSVPLAKLTPDDPTEYDAFGWSLATDGNLVVVGATQANGTAGAAYVFRNDTQVAKLTASIAPVGYDNPFGLSGFGDAVAIGNGDLIAVSAGIDYSFRGAIFIFQKTTLGTWIEIANLTARDDENIQDSFGLYNGLALDGNLIVAGDASSNETTGFATGAAYVYETLDGGTTWMQVTKLIGEAGYDEFGYATAIVGDLIVVGATQAENSTGAVYVYQSLDGSGWSFVTKLTASDAVEYDYKYFGWALATDGNLIIIGAPSDNDDKGAVYVYESLNNGATWAQLDKVTAIDGPTNYTRFGDAIALVGNRVFAGAPAPWDSAFGSADVVLIETV